MAPPANVYPLDVLDSDRAFVLGKQISAIGIRPIWLPHIVVNPLAGENLQRESGWGQQEYPRVQRARTT